MTFSFHEERSLFFEVKKSIRSWHGYDGQPYGSTVVQCFATTTLIITASMNNCLKLWDIETAGALGTLQEPMPAKSDHNPRRQRFAVTSDHQRLVTMVGNDVNVMVNIRIYPIDMDTVLSSVTSNHGNYLFFFLSSKRKITTITHVANILWSTLITSAWSLWLGADMHHMKNIRIVL